MTVQTPAAADPALIATTTFERPALGPWARARPIPPIAGRQSCTADRRPSRDRHPRSGLPQNLEKSILFCLSAFKPVDRGGIAALHKRNPLRKYVKTVYTSGVR